MINSIFSVLLFAILIFGWRRTRPKRNPATILWILISLLALGQTQQPSLWAILTILILQIALIALNDRTGWLRFKLFPLTYAAILLGVHARAGWNIPGISYLVLSSSLDLWMRLNEGAPAIPRFARAFNLISFPKLAVGPITAAKEHWAQPPGTEQIFRVILFGLMKAFVLVNLWRSFVPSPTWGTLHTPLDFLWFGFWQYVHLYLEFSGTCDLVAASFWLFGFGCPLNFNRPYAALTVTDFWKRWHITLGLWIRNHVFIAMGGSRVSKARIYLNLFLAMLLSGLWHGPSWNYLIWGALQGLFLITERAFDLEAKVSRMGPAGRFVTWSLTQFLVTCSWIVFFGKF